MASTTEKINSLFRDLSGVEPRPLDMGRLRKIAVISTPRCVSNYFCEVIRKTGGCGWPSEWFNGRFLRAWAELLNRKTVEISHYMTWVAQRIVTKDQIFSVNFHVEQYQWLLHHGVDVLDLGFDRLFYLSRRDKLGQAFSLRLAQITDQWTSEEDPVRPPPRTLTRSEIVKALHQIVAQEDYFDEHLRAKVDQEFHYEDFTGAQGREQFELFFERAGLADALQRLDLSTSLRPQRASYDSGSLRRLERYLSTSLLQRSN